MDIVSIVPPVSAAKLAEEGAWDVAPLRSSLQDRRPSWGRSLAEWRQNPDEEPSQAVSPSLGHSYSGDHPAVTSPLKCRERLLMEAIGTEA